MSAGVNEQFELLRAFMFERVYKNPVAKREEGKAKRMVEQLYLHYCAHLEEIPPEFLLRLDEDGRERVAADYIACMTDNYAINDFERLFVSRSPGPEGRKCTRLVEFIKGPDTAKSAGSGRRAAAAQRGGGPHGVP